MPEQNSSNLGKVADVLDEINLIVAKFIPLVGPFMGLAGTVIKLLRRPDLDPALRREAIAAMRANFSQLGVNADLWLAEHGYDSNGDPL